MKFLLLLLLGVFLFGPTFVYAQDTFASKFTFTGNDLIDLCDKKETTSYERSAACYAFLAGFIHGRYIGGLRGITDMHKALGANDELTKDFVASLSDPLIIGFCREGQDMEQIARVILKYYEDNPAIMHQQMGPHIENALQEAFPAASCM